MTPEEVREAIEEIGTSCGCTGSCRVTSRSPADILLVFLAERELERMGAESWGCCCTGQTGYQPQGPPFGVPTNPPSGGSAVQPP